MKLIYKLGVDLHADKDDLKILIADDFWQATTNILSFSIALPMKSMQNKFLSKPIGETLLICWNIQ